MTAIKLDGIRTQAGFIFFRFFFVVAAAEFRLGFGRCWIGFCDVLTLNNIDRNQRSLGRP